MRTTPEDRIQRYAADGWWGDETLDTLWRATARAVPERVALVDPPDRESIAFGPPQRLHYAELEAAVERLAAQLFEAGLRRDDRLIVQLPNVVELAAVYLACARLGIVVSPLPMQYGTHELSHVHGATDARAYLTLERFKGAPFAGERAKALPADVSVLVFGENGSIDLDREIDAAGYHDYLRSFAVDANDVFTICWTSGTTGQPKGVPRSFNHWRATTIASEDAVALPDGAVLLNPFPLVNMASIGGFLFLWLRLRGTLVLHHPFDAGVFLAQLQDEKVAYTVAPPALLSRLLQQPELLAKFDLSALRTIGSGSAPVAASLVDAYRQRLGIDILNLFGSNEGTCLVGAPNDVPHPEHRAAYFPRFGAPGVVWKNRAGRFLETRLVDLESGEEIEEPGRPGELRIAGPSVFGGYLGPAAANAEVFDEQGFFRTGDVFEIAPGFPDGRYLRFIGRSKDIIVRGGMKISPEELDTLLEGLPGVVECAVCGVADTELEQRVGVVVVPSEADAPALDAITSWLAERGVARFKWPERLAVVDALPRNALGKVVRRDLGPLFEEGSAPGA